MRPVRTFRLICADVLDGLAELDSESVHCVVTSPPYWALRSYQGVPGMIGLEPTFDEHLSNLVDVFHEVRRVLRYDGTLWLNYGDSYASNGTPGGFAIGKAGVTFDGNRAETRIAAGVVRKADGIGSKPKDLMMMPARVAMALQADGWWLRQANVWHKPNPMPEAAKDRTTTAHEYIFHLTKSARYFYDAEAIKEPVAGNAHARGDGVNPKAKPSPSGWDKGGGSHRKRLGRYPRSKQNESFAAATNELVSSRNKRSVWTIATEPFPGAHFATFPKKLVEPCVLAGTSERGVCGMCGAPWVRQIVSTGHVNQREPAHVPGHDDSKTDSTGWAPTTRATDEWQPACTCRADTVPATVLDPFAGSGTVGVVALRAGRSFVGIDLSLEYIDLARRRILGDAPLLNREHKEQRHGA